MILKYWDKFCALLSKAAFVFCMVLLVLMTTASAMQVITRYILNNTLSWTDECARYCFIWLNLIGAGCLVYSGGHAIVDLFSKKLKGNVKKVYTFLINAGIAYIGLVLLRYGFALCQATMKQKSTAMKIPMGLIYSVVPVCGVLIIIFEISILAHIFLDKDAEKGGK
ncbi:TRAP transporter small permease [bacterium 1XD42-54]|nr:TRAP transporter small permease [bacterium 1XD42-54]